MYEQIRLALNDIRQPVMCPPLVASQGLELPMGPSCQNLVDVAQGGIEGRLVVTAVVVDPAADVTVEHPCKIIQRLVAALMERPVSDSLPDRLESFAASRRTERDAEPLPPARQPRPKRIAEKIEPMVWVVSASIIVLAIDDFGLVRMQRQRALREPLLQRCPQRLGLFFTATMADRIIGVSLERNVRMVPRHPYVERVVQKEIRQERANYSPYAKGNFSFERVIWDWRTRIAVLDLRLKK
jgi:hypothetical protein